MQLYGDASGRKNNNLIICATSFYISPTTLKKYFRNIYGQPVYTWLSHKRMEKAAELLCYTSMTVLEIAQAVGYSSLSQFNVVLKKCYTCTPRQYRNS